MASKAFIKDISTKITYADLAELTARILLKETLEMAKEMSHDRGNDRETKASCLLAQVDTDELVGQCQDGLYSMMVDDFFDEVAEKMVNLAQEYVK